MFPAPRLLTLQVSTLALWGALAAAPQLAWGDSAAPAIRGKARLDAVVVNNAAGGFPEHICLNDGSGGFQTGSNCAGFNGTDASYGIALGDVDGDGDLDAVVANNGAVEQRCLNDGSGGFTVCASFNGTDISYGIALGDLDGDGDLDALVANAGNEQRCLNDGSGGFTVCASFNTNDNSRAVVLGDVDGDGDLDVVLANFGAVERRCLNDGSGGFTACASFNAIDNSRSIALGDVDNDGDMDVAVANGGAAEQRCLNDGAGGFTTCASFNATDNSRGMFLGDMDNDGDLDAVIANFGVAARRCLNEGSGSFTSCNSFNAATQSNGVALGDLKGDGPDGNLADVTPKFVGGAKTSNFALTLASMITSVKPAGLVALYEFDAQYCNINHAGQTVGKLRARTVRVSKGNALNFNGLTPAQYLTAPEWREGGVGSEQVVPEAGADYADGSLAPNECATLHYRFNLFSLSNYRFVVRLYGTVSGPDALPDSRSSANDLAAPAATEIELDLGALQAAPETNTPPATTPGGSAPAPVTPVLSFPAGTSNLPSRR